MDGTTDRHLVTAVKQEPLDTEFKCTLAILTGTATDAT